MSNVDVKDLRIGNFIYDNDGIVSKITGFTPFDHSTRCDETEGCLVLIDIYRPNGEISKGWECDSNTIKPIKLTEEWLLKFGFSNRDGWYGKKGIELFNIRGLYFRGNFPIEADICFVHELQNLHYALTKKELEIK